MIVHITLDGHKDQIEKLEDFKVHVNIEMPELEVIRDMMDEIRLWDAPSCRFRELQKKLEELVPRRKDND